MKLDLVVRATQVVPIGQGNPVHKSTDLQTVVFGMCPPRHLPRGAAATSVNARPGRRPCAGAILETVTAAVGIATIAA